MNLLQKIIKGCPDTVETEPKVIEKIVEVEKIVTVEKEVPVLVDPTEFNEAADEMRRAWDRVIKAEARCKELNMSVQYLDKNPPKPDVYYNRYPYVGSLSLYNLRVVANLIHTFEEKIKETR